MSVVVGTLQINVAAKTASFNADMDRVASTSRDKMSTLKSIFADFGESSSKSVGEASKALRLMGEEAGVRVPREIANVLSSFAPLAGTVNAAFSGIAIVGIIQVISEAVSKLEEWKAAAEHARDALFDLGMQGQEAMRKVDEEILSLQASIDDLNGNHLAALRDTLQNINNQSMDQLKGQLDSSFDAMQKVLADKSTTGVSWIGSFFGDESTKAIDPLLAKLKEAKQQIDQLAMSGDTSGIRNVLQQELQLTQQAEKYEGINQKAFTALQAIEGQLQNQLTLYQQINKAAEMKGTETLLKSLQSDREELKGLLADMDKLGKLEDSTVAITRQPSNILQTMNSLTQGISAQTPMYGGTSQAMDMEKVKTDQAFAIQQAQQIKTSIMSENDQWNQQLAIMKQLEQQGLLTGADLTKAIQQHQSALDQAKKNWSQLGGMIGNTLEQALLFGGNWKKALQSTLIDVAELILKMTLLKNLQAQTGQGEATGFFSSLVSGLLNKHAAGGSIPAGQWGIVGDAGPEAVYGGQTGMTVVPNYKREQPQQQSQPAVVNIHHNNSMSMNVSTPDAKLWKIANATHG